MFLSIPLKLFLSLILGAVIGLEREAYEKRINPEKGTRPGSLGLRTFALITALGSVSGLLKEGYFSLFLIISITFMLLLLCYYVLGSILTKDNGITTEIAIIFGYLIGVFISLEVFPIQLILAITVILILILSRKDEIRTIISGIKTSELNAFISFALIALVILPFLPNKSFYLSSIPALETILSAYKISLGKLGGIEILNPFKLWLVVALITGVDIFGYILEKTIGQKKGWLLTSIAGGFISSTATTQSLAQQSKKSGAVNRLVAAAIFATLASFFQVFILIASINGMFLAKSTPLILAIVLSSFLTGMFFLKLKKTAVQENLTETKEKLEEAEIFALSPALKFAFIFLLIRIATKVSLAFLGNSGFLAVSALASVTGIDAVVINLSEVTGSAINFKTGALALILANAVNLISKSVYSFTQGKKQFAVKFSLSMVIIIASSFLGLLTL